MSSGEGIQVPDQLMWFVKCPIQGCDWHVKGGGVCIEHGGARWRTQYKSGADGERFRVLISDNPDWNDAA